jgi:hypothetical protein
MPKSLRRAFPFLLSTALSGIVLLLSSCGGSSTSSSSVKTIVVTPSVSGISVNGQQVYTATAIDSNGNTVGGLTFTWTSSAIDVAPISTAGVATGKGGGTTQITATASDVTSSPATLTVLPAILSVSMSPITATIKVGQTQQFVATAKDVNGNAVTGAPFSWSNSFSGIATVDSNGLATGVSPGTVLITASLGGVTSPVATLTVTP